MPKYKQDKLEADARKNWDLFYKRNQTNFFKDRQWMTREFEEFKQFSEKVKQFYFCKNKKYFVVTFYLQGCQKTLNPQKTGV